MNAEQIIARLKLPAPDLVLAALVIALLVMLPAITFAHCDTMDGPVVADARKALETKDVTPVLKWVTQDHETEIREAFAKTLRVRAAGSEAKEMADMYFFETLVRIHRAGEGAPYTGLKPSGTEIDPAVLGADKALASGSVDALTKELVQAVADAVRARFAEALKKKQSADQSVEAGREFVEAYIQFTHFVERLHQNATTMVEHHQEGGTVEEEHN